MNGRTPTFEKAMTHGGFTALEGMINYTFNGFVGSFGKIGTSNEWWKNLLKNFYIKPFEKIFRFTSDMLD